MLKIFRGIILGVIIAALLYLIKSPSILIGPGTCLDTQDIIKLDASQQSTPATPQGRIYITTVSETSQIPILYHIIPFFKPYYQLQPVSFQSTSRQLAQSSNPHVDLSFMLARAAAEQQALDSKLQAQGVIVSQVSNWSQEYLQEGDILTHFDGKPIKGGEHLTRLFQRKLRQGWEQAKLKFLRNGLSNTVHYPLKPTLKDNYELGFHSLNYYGPESFLWPAQIRDLPREKQFSGASAGCAFALALLQHYHPQTLRIKQDIAITGALMDDGRILPVEGSAFKAIAAQHEGVQYFFCPQENITHAKSFHPQLTVIGVRTLSELVKKIQEI